MSTLIPEMALDFQKVAGHLVQLLLNVISSAHCRLDDLLRIFSHVTPLEPASSRGPEPSLLAPEKGLVGDGRMVARVLAGGRRRP